MAKHAVQDGSEGRITFHALSEIAPGDLVRLFNDPRVRRHMPLADALWDEAGVRDWAKGKDAQWQENGYGPWGIRIDGTFVGWGGFQKEGDEADLGLVLLPAYWGFGAMIFRELVRRAREMRLSNVTLMLPPSRVRMKGLARLGFTPAGECAYDGTGF